jgi:hypothetical protein
MSYVVMGADCTNAFANIPSPTQLTPFDDAYTDWYRSNDGKQADRFLVLSVFKTFQGDSGTGARS